MQALIAIFTLPDGLAQNHTRNIKPKTRVSVAREEIEWGKSNNYIRKKGN